MMYACNVYFFYRAIYTKYLIFFAYNQSKWIDLEYLDYGLNSSFGPDALAVWKKCKNILNN